MQILLLNAHSYMQILLFIGLWIGIALLGLLLSKIGNRENNSDF